MSITNRAYERLRKISEDAETLNLEYQNSKMLHEKLKRHIKFKSRIGRVE